MALLREYFWLFIVFGIIFVSLFIGLLFIIINNWITSRAQQFKINALESASHEFYAESSVYHPKQLAEELPSLPARNPSLSSCPSVESYVDVADIPDYLKVEEEVVPPPYRSAAGPAQRGACPDRYSVSTELYDDVVLPGYESDEDYDDVA